MKLKQWFVLIAVAVLAIGAAPSDSLAATKSQQKLQQNLATMHGDLEEVLRQFPNRIPTGLAKRAKQSQRALKKLSKDELALLDDLLRLAPNWQMTPALLASALAAQEIQASAALAPAPNCPAGLPNGILDWYIARDVAQGLDFAQIFAPDDLVTVGGGFGGTISAHPVKILLQVGFESAQIAALVLEQIYFIADECESNAHQELLRQVDDKLDGIEQQFKIVKAAQRQIMRLLLIDDAEDRRIDPAVLTCTGDDCPRVLDCPGKECRGEIGDD